MHPLFEQRVSPSLVLVVDDDPVMRHIIRQQMEVQGYQVIEAEDCGQALATCQQNNPDVILLDVLMPNINGFTCCRELLSLDQERRPLVLMITALSDEASIQQAFAVGAIDYVTKPIDWSILHQRVRRLVHQSYLIKQLRQYNLALEDYVITQNATIREQTLQLHKALELESILKYITDLVRDSLDESQILQTAVEQLAQTLQVRSGVARVYDTQQQTSQMLYKYHTSIREYLNCTLVVDGFPEVDHALLQGFSVYACTCVPDLLKHPAAFFAFPIHNGSYVGDLWLICEPDRTLDELEVRLVEQVLNQCVIGIRQARLYKAAQTQVQQLERLNELKDDFLSTISHELRSPLSTMRIAIQMLEKSLEEHLREVSATPDAAKTANYLRILNTECEREIALIDDLLNLQQLDAGVYSLVPKIIHLQDWIPAELEPLAIRALNRRQTIQVHLADALSPFKTDAVCLRRIFTELVSNACKYSPPDALITIAVVTTERQVQLSVTNTGTEIHETEQPRIFDRFYRIPASDRWQQGGTGLGLALIKRLVEHLGGTISVSSMAGNVCFTVVLQTQPPSA